MHKARAATATRGSTAAYGTLISLALLSCILFIRYGPIPEHRRCAVAHHHLQLHRAPPNELPAWAAALHTVQHMWLPGTLDPINGSSVAGLLHVWLRAHLHGGDDAAAEDGCWLKGFAYFWVPDNVKQVKYKFQQVKDITALPAMYIECGLTDAMQGGGYTEQYNLTTYTKGPDAQYNIYIQGRVPGRVMDSSVSSSCALRIQGWISAWPLHPTLSLATTAGQSPSAQDTEILGAITVMGTFYHDLPIDWVVRLWKVHCDMYRHAWGFSGALWYRKSLSLPLKEAISQTACAGPLQQGSTGAQEGPPYLHWHVWEELPLFLGSQRGLFINEHEKYEQNIVHNHALLALAWTGYAVLLTDLDELLGAPKPTTLPNPTTPPQSKQESTMTAYPQLWYSVLQDCVGGDDALQGAAVLWLTCMDIVLPLRASVQSGMPEVLSWGNSTRQTLEQYRHSSTAMPYRKGFVLRPEAMAQYVVHVGSTLNDIGLQLDIRNPVGTGGLSMEVNTSCVQCLHMRNVLQKRRMDIGNFVEDTSWHWLLP